MQKLIQEHRLLKTSNLTAIKGGFLMKKILNISFILVLVLMFSSCAGVVNETEKVEEPVQEAVPIPEPVPVVKIYEEANNEILTYLCKYYGLDKILYDKVKEGALSYSENVTELPETISFEQVIILKKLIKHDPDLFFVKDVILSDDMSLINISYEMDKTQAEKESNSLAEIINYFIESSVNSEYTEAENVLSVYGFLSRNAEALPNEELSLYDLFIKGKSNSFSFAKAMRLILKYAGIDSNISQAVEGPAWLTAKVDGKSYHFSPYMESEINHGKSLEFFGLSDDEMHKLFSEWITCDGIINVKCKSELFKELRTLPAYGIDFTNKLVYYIDINDNNKLAKYSYTTGEKESVFDKRAQDMEYFDGNIYFSDLDSRNKLYKLDLISGKQDELDTVYVTRMYSRGNKLIYFDDVSNTEGSIVLK